MKSQPSNGSGNPEALAALKLLAHNSGLIADGLHRQNQLLEVLYEQQGELRDSIINLTDGIDEISDVAVAFNGLLGRVSPTEMLRMPGNQILSILATEVQAQLARKRV